MDRDWLAARLEAGDSIEAIAREVRKHPSTVSYWANKHGLASAHAVRHAARGGIPREVLAELACEGLSVRAMAARLGCSAATVRHWLRKHDVETHRTSQLRSTRDGRAGGANATLRACAIHGATTFVLDTDGYYRCPKCRADSVIRRRARIRAEVIAEAGGCCAICGYSRHLAALQFHHLDPATKEFTLCNGETRSLERMRAEAAKCVLLCANCHAEVESGAAQVPVPSRDRRPSGVSQPHDPG
jgi:transposase-like protein/5-methylcytosine-specific restriction endonuclease McrA